MDLYKTSNALSQHYYRFCVVNGLNPVILMRMSAIQVCLAKAIVHLVVLDRVQVCLI